MKLDGKIPRGSGLSDSSPPCKAGHKNEQNKLGPETGKLVIHSTQGNALLLGVHNGRSVEKATWCYDEGKTEVSGTGGRRGLFVGRNWA